LSVSERTIARRYARAAVDVATTLPGEAASALGAEIAWFARLVADHPALRATLQHPGLAVGPRRRLVAGLAEKAGASDLLRRLLDLMADRGRLDLLGAVAEAYREELDVRRGVVTAQAVSAQPLSDGQRQALALALGGNVDLRARVDPAVLGGVLLRIGGLTFDGTVRARLAALRRRLAAGR
jgi:F-type H+-transporting ATPase subunit delta